MAQPTTINTLAYDENLGYIRQAVIGHLPSVAQKAQGMAATATTPSGNPLYIGGFDKTGFVRPLGLGSGARDATTQRITIATDDPIVIALGSLEKLSKGAGAVLATTLRITQALDILTPTGFNTVSTTPATPMAVGVNSTFFQSMVIYGKKAARTVNAATVFLGFQTTNDTQDFQIAPGEEVTITAPINSKFDLNNFQLDIVTSGDGVRGFLS